MESAKTVLINDLEYICAHLEEEFRLLAGKRTLLTGGAGFLGYYLVQGVLYWNAHAGPDRPIRLTVYDNFIRGVPQWLTNLEANPHLSLVQHDVTKPLPEDVEPFHYVIHAASVASPTYYRQYPIETMDANVEGLRILLEYARAQKEQQRPLSGFLYFSTSEIYGSPTPENIPTPETYNGNVSCTGPRACYDESKRYGETLCVNFAQQYDLPITIARPFNNYGPGLKITDKRVIPDFAMDIMAGRDITLLSDGSPTRTFCYVADAVVGYYKILVKGRQGEPYNIGVAAPEISIRELALKMVGLASDLFGYHGKVNQAESPDQNYLVDNPNRRCPVITKARNELGYEPSIALGEGLQRALIWYDANREGKWV